MLYLYHYDLWWLNVLVQWFWMLLCLLEISLIHSNLVPRTCEWRFKNPRYPQLFKMQVLPAIPCQVPIAYVSWPEATNAKTNMVPIPTNPDFFLVNSTSQVWANDIFQEPDPFPEIKEGFPLQFTIFWPHNESFTRDQHAKLLRIFLVGFLGHDGPSNGWAVDSPKKVSILSCSHGRSWNRRQQSLIHPKISQNILIHHKNHATIHPTLSEIIMLQLEKNTYKMKGNEYWRYTPFSAEPRVSGRKR